jgi:hypothetical protein
MQIKTVAPPHNVAIIDLRIYLVTIQLEQRVHVESAGTFNRPFDRYAAHSSRRAPATNGASPGAGRGYFGCFLCAVDVPRSVQGAQMRETNDWGNPVEQTLESARMSSFRETCIGFLQKKKKKNSLLYNSADNAGYTIISNNFIVFSIPDRNLCTSKSVFIYLIILNPNLTYSYVTLRKL